MFITFPGNSDSQPTFGLLSASITLAGIKGRLAHLEEKQFLTAKLWKKLATYVSLFGGHGSEQVKPAAVLFLRCRNVRVGTSYSHLQST